MVVNPNWANAGGSSIETAPIGDIEEDNISCTITFYTSQTLHTIALCYHDFRCWPSNNMQLLDNEEVTDLFLIDEARD